MKILEVVQFIVTFVVTIMRRLVVSSDLLAFNYRHWSCKAAEEEARNGPNEEKYYSCTPIAWNADGRVGHYDGALVTLRCKNDRFNNTAMRNEATETPSKKKIWIPIEPWKP
jgi:hypothetical protein